MSCWASLTSSFKAERMKRCYPLAILFLGSGAALVAYIITGLWLLVGVGLGLLVLVVLGALLWRRACDAERTWLLRRLRIGLVAGVLATGAYDLSRLALVKFGAMRFQPFESFTLFGQALLGTHQPSGWVTAAGTGYHLLNGLSFAVAYTVAAGHRGVRAGIVWALMLETAMVSLYPGWLGLKALDEFLQVSILGHLAYGAVLGLVAQRLLSRPHPPDRAAISGADRMITEDLPARVTKADYVRMFKRADVVALMLVAGFFAAGCGSANEADCDALTRALRAPSGGAGFLSPTAPGVQLSREEWLGRVQRSAFEMRTVAGQVKDPKLQRSALDVADYLDKVSSGDPDDMVAVMERQANFDVLLAKIDAMLVGMCFR